MKIAGQFQADIKNYIENCYRKNINPTDALIGLMEDRIYTVSEIFDKKRLS